MQVKIQNSKVKIAILLAVSCWLSASPVSAQPKKGPVIGPEHGGLGRALTAGDTAQVLVANGLDSVKLMPYLSGGGSDTTWIYTQNNNNFTYGSGNATSICGYSTAIGIGALANQTTGSENTAIGNQALSDDTDSYGNVAIGYLALPHNNLGVNTISIGNHSGHRSDNEATNYSECILLGARAGDNVFSLSNSFVVGSSTLRIDDIYFGKGVRNSTGAGVGYGFTLHATAADSAATDANGGSITLAGGISTGSGHGGSIIFKSSPYGTTGTSDNALEELLRINDSGAVTFTKDHGEAGQVLTSNGVGQAASWQNAGGGATKNFLWAGFQIEETRRYFLANGQTNNGASGLSYPTSDTSQGNVTGAYNCHSDGILKYLYVKASNAPTGTEVDTVWLIKNGVPEMR